MLGMLCNMSLVCQLADHMQRPGARAKKLSIAAFDSGTSATVMHVIVLLFAG